MTRTRAHPTEGVFRMRKRKIVFTMAEQFSEIRCYAKGDQEAWREGKMERGRDIEQ